MAKDLTKIPLEELHIFKQNAYQTLAKLERLLGNLPSAMQSNSYDYKDFMYFSNVYKQLEEEMNDRIIKAVENEKETKTN